MSHLPLPLTWTLSPFDALSPHTLYEALALRQEVFILEQDCRYLDADGVDLRALHLIGRDQNDNICAYLRAFQDPPPPPQPPHPLNPNWSIGRVLIRQDRRGEGLGQALVQEALTRLQARGARRFALHAQSHLKGFYEALGFQVTGEEFTEAGIPHLPMERHTPAPQLKQLIFDLDGTLIDSSYDYAACFEQLALEWGRPRPSSERIRALMFAGLNPQLNEALGPLNSGEHERAVKRFREICLAHPLTHTQLYPGALALLNALKAHGYGLSVCTNRPQDLCEQVLNTLRLRGYFNHVVGGDRGLERKPAPDMLHHTLSALSLSPQEALMVGDSEVDVEAARAAGVECAAVTWGYTPLSTLTAARPALLLHHPHDLLTALTHRATP